MAELDIPEPVASFIDTVNRQDTEGFLDSFIAGGAVDDWGRTFTGREVIKTWSDREFIGSKGFLTPEEVDSKGAEVTVIGDWRSNHANGRSKFIFQIDGDKFAKMTIREG